jgi:hypothetical protein
MHCPELCSELTLVGWRNSQISGGGGEGTLKVTTFVNRYNYERKINRYGTNNLRKLASIKRVRDAIKRVNIVRKIITEKQEPRIDVCEIYKAIPLQAWPGREGSISLSVL